MAGFHSASDYMKTAFFLVLATFVTLIVIFFTPYWTVDPDYDAYAGLWQACNMGVCYDRWNMWVEEWVKATQAFVILSMLCTGWEVFMTSLFIFHRNFEDDKRLVMLCMIGSFATSFFMFLAITVWGGSQYLATGESLSWCFAFAVFLVPMAAISGLLYLLELRKPVQLGEDLQNLLEKEAETVNQQATQLHVVSPEQGNNPLDLTLDYGAGNTGAGYLAPGQKRLATSMKSGLNTSMYQSKQPLS